MKTATIFHLALGFFIVSLLFSVLALTPQPARAQGSGYPEPSEFYSREELAQMLAPIALYPDALLAQVLMASTYPIEVIEAERWLRKNPELKDAALDAVLLDKSWDASVKAVCHFPSILSLMSERITETTSLGNAFLGQEAEVMGMVQELRARAHAQGHLTTSPTQTIIVERETIVIRPADPRVIYVPYYDPFLVYGSWWYPAYPPYYWGPPRVRIGYSIAFWPGVYYRFAFGSWSTIDWRRHYVHIDVHKRPKFVRHDRWLATSGRWQHSSIHRRGVAYRNQASSRKFVQAPSHTREIRRESQILPEARQQDLARRIDNRTAIKRIQHKDDRTGIERDRRDRERISKEREQAARNHLGQQRSERERQEQHRTENKKQEQRRGESDRQKSQGADQERTPKNQVAREPQQEPRGHVVKQVEDGRGERQSSERSRARNKGLTDGSRDRGRSGADNRGSREERGGMGRMPG